MTPPAPKNVGAKGVSYFTPAQTPPVGTAVEEGAPTLFRPLRIRDVVFGNRIWVAPMCEFSFFF